MGLSAIEHDELTSAQVAGARRCRDNGIALEAMHGDGARHAVFRQALPRWQHQVHELECLRLEQAGGHRIAQPGTERSDVDDIEGSSVWQCHGVSVSDPLGRDRL